MLHDRSADLLAAPVDELDHFLRQAGLEQNLDEERTRVRHVFGRLENDGVSAHQSGKHLPGWDSHRKIERTDQARDSDRSPVTHRPLVPQFTGNGFAKQPAPFACCIVGGVYSLLHIPTCLGERLPHLPRHRVRDFFLSPGHDVADDPQYVPARRCGRPPPTRKSTLCAFDGALDIATIRQRKFPDDISAIGRIAVVEVLTGLRPHPFTSDIVVELFHLSFCWSYVRFALPRTSTLACRSAVLARERVSLDLLVKVGPRHLHCPRR